MRSLVRSKKKFNHVCPCGTKYKKHTKEKITGKFFFQTFLINRFEEAAAHVSVDFVYSTLNGVGFFFTEYFSVGSGAVVVNLKQRLGVRRSSLALRRFG